MQTNHADEVAAQLQAEKEVQDIKLSLENRHEILTYATSKSNTQLNQLSNQPWAGGELRKPEDFMDKVPHEIKESLRDVIVFDLNANPDQVEE